MSDHGCIVMKKANQKGSLLYRLETTAGSKILPTALSEAAPADVEVIMISLPDAFPEYGPYREVETADELFAYLESLAEDPT